MEGDRMSIGNADKSAETLTAPAIEMQSICKSYGPVRALQNVDLTLYPNEILGLVGDNAAGKSTLMKVLSGAIQKDSGRILLADKEVNFSNPIGARQIGIEMVHQDFALCKNVSIAGNIFMAREPRKGLFGKFLGLMDARKMLSASEILLRKQNVEISDCRKLAGALSGGQQQSIAIARAVGFDARVVIMDEPTASLGVKQSKRLLQLIHDLPKRGISVILITHRMQDVFDVCNRIMVLKSGRNAGTFKTNDVTIDEIVRLMILGREEASSEADLPASVV